MINFIEENYLIQNGFYSMHGRGMFFDINTGEVFEGWFVNNNLIKGRCILDDTYYVGYFKSTLDGKYVKDGKGT